MATINFADARQMATDSDVWMKKVSDYIKDPNKTKPIDIYPTQKLAFEMDKSDLAALLDGDRVVGILGYEGEYDTLTVILVSLDENGRPSEAVKPRQVWPLLKKMKELEDVLDTYLTPKE